MFKLDLEKAEERKKLKLLSCVRLSATPWTVAHQGSLSMRFSRQEYWSGLTFPSPGDLPDPAIEPRYPALQADALLTQLLRRPLHVQSGEKTEKSKIYLSKN